MQVCLYPCVCLRACGHLSTRLLARVYTEGCPQTERISDITPRRKPKRLSGQEALEDGSRPERR